MEVPEGPEVPEVPAPPPPPPEVPEEPSEPSEPVVIKRRGRPKGSLNKKTVEKMQVEREPSPPPALTLDVDFTSEAVLGETTPPPKRKPKTRAKPPPPPPSESEEDEPPPPPPQKLKRERTTNRNPRVEPEALNRPNYLEILTRGLKEQRAKQYAEKVAQYDRFFQW